MSWITGSPTVSVEIGDPLIKLYGKNVQLMAIYLASYGRHVLENGSAATTLTSIRAALISMRKAYQKGIEIKKSKEMEKLVKLKSDAELDEYIQSHFHL